MGKGLQDFAEWSLKELSQISTGASFAMLPYKLGTKNKFWMGLYTPVNKKIRHFDGFYSEKGGFSWAMLVSGRVTPVSL